MEHYTEDTIEILNDSDVSFQEPIEEDRPDLVEKAFQLIANKLDVTAESEEDLRTIKDIRMKILTGKKY